MKILIYTDPHWCTYSSIVRTRGNNFSVRLENLIDSINWVENISKERGCSAVVCLGDFFDKHDLSCEEVTALKEIKWNTDAKHHFIVGNHESNVTTLDYSSTKALEQNDINIISKPTSLWGFDSKGVIEFVFIPYLLEEYRKPLNEYFDKDNLNAPNKTRTIVFSHNDIKGIQYGSFESKEGFSIDEIDSNCNLFLNGHLHNRAQFSTVGYNVGNLTGQNFGEDATKYKHGCVILDTETMTLEFIENPYAFNFFKIDINSEKDISILKTLSNAIVTFKCSEDLVKQLKEELANTPNIICSKVVVVSNNIPLESGELAKLNNINYLEQFSKYILDNVDNSQITVDELIKIVGNN